MSISREKLSELNESNVTFNDLIKAYEEKTKELDDAFLSTTRGTTSSNLEEKLSSLAKYIEASNNIILSIQNHRQTLEKAWEEGLRYTSKEDRKNSPDGGYSYNHRADRNELDEYKRQRSEEEKILENNIMKTIDEFERAIKNEQKPNIDMQEGFRQKIITNMKDTLAKKIELRQADYRERQEKFREEFPIFSSLPDFGYIDQVKFSLDCYIRLAQLGDRESFQKIYDIASSAHTYGAGLESSSETFAESRHKEYDEQVKRAYHFLAEHPDPIVSASGYYALASISVYEEEISHLKKVNELVPGTIDPIYINSLERRLRVRDELSSKDRGFFPAVAGAFAGAFVGFVSGVAEITAEGIDSKSTLKTILKTPLAFAVGLVWGAIKAVGGLFDGFFTGLDRGLKWLTKVEFPETREAVEQKWRDALGKSNNSLRSKRNPVSLLGQMATAGVTVSTGPTSSTLSTTTAASGLGIDGQTLVHTTQRPTAVPRQAEARGPEHKQPQTTVAAEPTPAEPHSPRPPSNRV